MRMQNFTVSYHAATENVGLFRQVLEGCKLTADETLLLFTDTQFYPHYPAAFMAAGQEIGDPGPVRHAFGQLGDSAVPPLPLFHQIVVVELLLAPLPVGGGIGEQVDGKSDIGGAETRGVEGQIGQL